MEATLSSSNFVALYRVARRADFLNHAERYITSRLAISSMGMELRARFLTLCIFRIQQFYYDTVNKTYRCHFSNFRFPELQCL